MSWLTDTILRLAGPLVLVVVFALPALEASTLLGIVVPGELALVLGGLLAHQGRVPLWAAVVAGAAGAASFFSCANAAGTSPAGILDANMIGPPTAALAAAIPAPPIKPRRVVSVLRPKATASARSGSSR